MSSESAPRLRAPRLRGRDLALVLAALLVGLVLQAHATEPRPADEPPSLDPSAATALPAAEAAASPVGDGPFHVASHHEHETNPCNPCGAKNPCSANPCNPCGAKNPCGGANPCSGADIDPKRFKKPAGLDFEAPPTPAMLAEGEALWNDRSLGSSGLACSTCHEGKYGQMQASFAKPYPHRVEMPAQQAGVAEVDAAEMVNFCMIVPMQDEPLAWDSTELAALTAYVEHIQKDFEPASTRASSANPCNPCGGKNPCNPCGGPNPCNPCGGANPCSP